MKREFTAAGPNQIWCADIGYVPTQAGFLYLANVLDVWSRREVGWSMRDDLTTPLVTDALDMTLPQRKPDRLIHHSDRGTQAAPTRTESRRTPSVFMIPGPNSRCRIGRCISGPSLALVVVNARCSTGASILHRTATPPGGPASGTSRSDVQLGGGTAGFQHPPPRVPNSRRG